ncbi:MAG: ERCC4 helicase [Thaumarchaeota archaeon 13_1_40CM_38_12]|nr:MAG: ERCC4 helicase [Thaumarchaeota archaeon 13_1_40CM_38_12]OLC36245.1 MAG: ERCC4 helicase [Thaumarchaeota archaeon 13_1_40CM_4_38_7]TLY04039.1 MAG: DEAD/DEAH box helicase [Nitrososphaerota archaeon]
MNEKYLEHHLIKKSTIEYRDYQINLAKQAIGENCLIVLPTGLGKTTVALQVIAELLSKRKGGVLFLAPTRVLAQQHYEFLRNNLLVDDIALITGEDLVNKRKKLWINSVVCATPEIVKNDLDRQLVPPHQFSLIIFDEAHRTIGDYAYAGIAERFQNLDVRIIGMTATLPSEKEKASEILRVLKISNIAQRTEDSPDVQPYVKQTDTEWITVELSSEMKQIQFYIKNAIESRYTELRRTGLNLSNSRSLSELLRVREFVLRQNRRAAKPLFTAIRLIHALNVLESHGITTFLRFCERTRQKKGIGIKDLFENDPNFSRAIKLAKEAQAKGIEHPKLIKLKEILEKISGKALIFTSYRDSVDVIHQKLTEMGISAGFLIGKAGETGLKQKEQVEAVQKFRDAKYKVLIATRVGEEGLDISEVNCVIFFDNVPSSIRYVQRKGRTGRKGYGKLIVLIAKDTTDETYYWIGKRKVAAAKKMGEKMSKMLEQQELTSKTGLDAFF